MIKVIASELLKSCLIENHIPEGLVQDQDDFFAESPHVEIGELPEEFSAASEKKNDYTGSMAGFFAENQ